nr:reverse transcriptase domain, viral movement protein [Tanacetum cinerariifolium]
MTKSDQNRTKTGSDDEPSDSVLCTIAYSDLSSDDDSDTESDSDFGVHMINPIPHVLPIQEDPPLPLEKIHLITDAYVKPIPVIAFFDTGSSVSILNSNILLDRYWKPHHQNFMAANGENFVIEKISAPINIRLFPKCVIKRRLLDFLQKLSHHTAWLFPMLKKNPPQWTSRQTEAVKAIKSLAEKMPPLKTPASSEKRILQTDASDECWGAMVNNHRKRDLRTGNVLEGQDLFYHLKPLMMMDLLFTMPHIALFMTGTRLTYQAEDHLDAYKWIEANGQWLYDNIDHCEVETSDDDDDARSSIDLHNSPPPYKVGGVMQIYRRPRASGCVGSSSNGSKCSSSSEDQSDLASSSSSDVSTSQ